MYHKVKTLLLVEDEAIIAIAKKKRLENIGYTVQHALTGEKAIELALDNDSTIDLILMDIDLGSGIDGTVAAQEILKQKDIPVLFLSSHTEKEVVDKTEKITSYGYVVKNSGITILDTSIKMAFKLFEAHKEINRRNMAIEAGNENLRVTIEKLEETNISLLHTQNQLSLNEMRYKKAQRMGQVGNWEYNIKTNRIWGSEEALRIYNLPPETETLTLEEVEIMDYDRERMKRALINLIQNEEDYNLVFEITPRNSKEPKWIHSIAELKKNENGIPFKVIGVIQDITIQIKNESALKELSLAIDNSSDVIFITDINGIITFLNQKFTEVYGYSGEEIIGVRQPGILNCDKIEDDDEAQFWKELTIQKSLKQEFKNVSKTGKIIYAEASIDPLYDIYGNLTGYLVIQRDITERRKTEEQLQQSEESLSITLQSIGDGVIATDLDGNISRMNTTAEKLTGFTLEESIHKPLEGIFKIINAETRKKVENPVKKVIKSGNIVELANHTVLINKSGNEYQIADSAAPIKDKGGKIQGVILVFYDVTEKYEAEKQIESLARFPEENPNPVLRFDSTGKVLYSNPSSKEIVDTMQKAENKCISNSLREIIRQVYINDISMEKEFTLNNKIFQFTFNPINSYNYINVYAQDITTHRHEEYERRRVEKLFEAMFETIPDAVVITDTERKVLLANKAISNVFGYEPEEIIGQETKILYDKDNSYETSGITYFNKHSKENDNRYVTNYKDKSKKTFPGETIGAKLYDVEGSWIGNLGIMRDISDQVHLMNDLSNAKDTAEKNEREKELLLTEVHHRIKNNMSTGAGLLSLQANSPENKNSAEVLLKAENRIQSMMILYDILYKSENFGTISLDEYLSKLVKKILDNITPDDLTISTQFNFESTIKLDAKRMSLVGIIINELITNIIKYAFKGRESGTITIEASNRHGKIQLSIADNGSGIPESGSLTNSTGFGFQLINLLSEQLNGKIRIENEKGTKIILETDQ